MGRKKRLPLFLIFTALCLLISTGTADSQSIARKVHEEYGTELRRGTLVTHADTSTSTVRDWRHAPAVPQKGFLGDVEQFVYKRTKITDGNHIGESRELSMRILFDRNAEGPRPVILCIPGGGFMSSDMDNMDFYSGYFADHGFVAAVIEYRTIGQGRYMDGVADIRDAIRGLRAHADKYGIDPENIGLFGASAGGHMAALTAVAPDLDKFRGEGNLGYSHEVQAVVSLFGTSDLTRIAMDLDSETQQFHTLPQTCEAQYVNGVLSGMGILDDPEEARLANPITYLDGDEPPFLHMHGDEDNLISPSMSLLLHEALLKHHDISVRYSLQGENHGSAGFFTEPALNLILAFCERHLCRTPAAE